MRILLVFFLSACAQEQPAPLADMRSGSAAGSRLRAQLGVGGAGGQTREKALGRAGVEDRNPAFASPTSGTRRS